MFSRAGNRMCLAIGAAAVLLSTAFIAPGAMLCIADDHIAVEALPATGGTHSEAPLPAHDAEPGGCGSCIDLRGRETLSLPAPRTHHSGPAVHEMPALPAESHPAAVSDHCLIGRQQAVRYFGVPPRVSFSTVLLI